MKKLLLFVTMLLLTTASRAQSPEAEIGGLWYILLEDKTAVVIKSQSNAYTGEIMIPASVEYGGESYRVVALSEAFKGCDGITSVDISEGIINIGSYSFYGCSNMTSVSIPRSVTIIDGSSFEGCSRLTSIIIPNSVTYIGKSAFWGCSSLTSISIPSSVTSIGMYVIGGCDALESVKVDEGNNIYDSRENCNAIIKTADNELIAGCKNTVIPNNINSIGNWALYLCRNLISIIIPDNVTTIGLGAFSGCSNLETIIIGNGITKVGDNSFYNCGNMKDFYCFAEQVPTAPGDPWTPSYARQATLHVPAGSVSLYQNKSPWRYFGNIVALTDDDPKPTGIGKVMAKLNGNASASYYTLDGKLISEPQHGLNIVRMSDGTTQKLTVK